MFEHVNFNCDEIAHIMFNSTCFVAIDTDVFMFTALFNNDGTVETTLETRVGDMGELAWERRDWVEGVDHIVG